jgi:DNA-binding GntR family transcriptional regulator
VAVEATEVGVSAPEAGAAQERVLAILRAAIMSGELAPGSRLRQAELAELCHTTRMPVREALRALELEGLVRSDGQRGYSVTAIDSNDIDEIFDMRILLESHAVQLAVPLLTDEDIERLEAIYERMTTAETADERFVAREDFFTTLFGITGRMRLLAQIQRLRLEVARALRWPTVAHSPHTHQQFFEAIRLGDADRAVAHLSAHYRGVAAQIHRHLRSQAIEGVTGGSSRRDGKAGRTG